MNVGRTTCVPSVFLAVFVVAVYKVDDSVLKCGETPVWMELLVDVEAKFGHGVLVEVLHIVLMNFEDSFAYVIVDQSKVGILYIF